MVENPLELVRATARLARLELGEAELERLAPQLARILDAFEALARFPVRPMAAGEPELDRSRPDEPAPSLDRDVVMNAAPASADGFFAVPRAIGGEP